MKVKKETKNVDPKIVQTKNGLYRIEAKCPICKTNKNKFNKKPENVIKLIPKQKLNKKETIIEADEIHANIRRKFPKRKIITLGIEDSWAADLVIMFNYTTENDGYMYLLNVIDTFSKYAWVKPLRKKNGNGVSKVLKKLLKMLLKLDINRLD